MQQNSFLFSTPSSFPPGDERLHFQNTNSFPVSPSGTAWSGNYPSTIGPGPVPAYNGFERSAANYGVSPPQNAFPPVSTAIYGTTPTCSWAHTVPQLMPWVTKSDTNIPETIVRFTAPFLPDPCTSQTATSWELLNNLGANKTSVNMHLKRKSDLDLDPAPQKMCITEERMAARLRELHISNQYCVPSENSQFGAHGDSTNVRPVEKSVTNLQELDAMLKSSENGSKSLVLAPELKKLVEPEKLFARTFLDKVERPSMAVVLWQPQKTIPGLNNNSSDTQTSEKKEDDEEITIEEVDNNNIFSQNSSAICHQNASFSTPKANQVSSSACNFEDVMDT